MQQGHKKLGKKRIIRIIINPRNTTDEQENKYNHKVLNGSAEKVHVVIIMQSLGIDVAIIHEIILGKWEHVYVCVHMYICTRTLGRCTSK